MGVQAEEAEATYRTCVADAPPQQQELEHTKVTVLRQLQEVIKQSDQTLRSVSTHTHTHTHNTHGDTREGPTHTLHYMQVEFTLHLSLSLSFIL